MLLGYTILDQYKGKIYTPLLHVSFKLLNVPMVVTIHDLLNLGTSDREHDDMKHP